MTAGPLAAGLDIFGEGSSFVTIVLVICVIGPVALWFLRRALQSQRLKDLVGVSMTFMVLLFVAMLMMVFEHSGG
jgi:uncharacterized Tic20 family protein